MKRSRIVLCAALVVVGFLVSGSLHSGRVDIANTASGALLLEGPHVGAVVRDVVGADARSTSQERSDAQVIADEAKSGALEFFAVASVADEVLVLDYDHALMGAAARDRRPVLVRDFPLSSVLQVDLKLRSFSVTGPNTRFVIGQRHGPDVLVEFDTSQIVLLRGSVPDAPGSHVFLALSPGRSTGRIDLGAGRASFLVSSRDHTGKRLENGRISVFPASSGGGSSPAVPICGVADTGDLIAGGVVGARPIATGEGAPRRGLKHMELAVDTDFEYFQLFGDVDEAFTYLVEMYGAVSDIYMRDVDTRIELVFGRIWDDPDDLFNEPSPLGAFRDYWNRNMGHVHRDVAQLFSGRRNYPFGGQATGIGNLCTNSAYSVVGYAMGFFPDPTRPDPYHYDIFVTAHEIGHNAGTHRGRGRAWPACRAAS